jgi:hypothetical protein
MIEAQKKMMGATDLWRLEPALLAGAAAPLMNKLVIRKLIEEAAPQRPNATPVDANRTQLKETSSVSC